MDISLSKLQEIVMDREAWWLQSMGSQRVGRDWVTKQQKQLLRTHYGWHWSKSFIQVNLLHPHNQSIIVPYFVGEESEKSSDLSKVTQLSSHKAETGPQACAEPLLLTLHPTMPLRWFRDLVCPLG